MSIKNLLFGFRTAMLHVFMFALLAIAMPPTQSEAATFAKEKNTQSCPSCSKDLVKQELLGGVNVLKQTSVIRPSRHLTKASEKVKTDQFGANELYPKGFVFVFQTLKMKHARPTRAEKANSHVEPNLHLLWVKRQSKKHVKNMRKKLHVTRLKRPQCSRIGLQLWHRCKLIHKTKIHTYFPPKLRPTA